MFTFVKFPKFAFYVHSYPFSYKPVYICHFSSLQDDKPRPLPASAKVMPLCCTCRVLCASEHEDHMMLWIRVNCQWQPRRGARIMDCVLSRGHCTANRRILLRSREEFHRRGVFMSNDRHKTQTEVYSGHKALRWIFLIGASWEKQILLIFIKSSRSMPKVITDNWVI